MFFLHPPFPIPDSLLDLATLVLTSSLLLLSLLSLSFILHLRLKSRSSHYLHPFNSLWTVRTLLVFIVTLWAINEFLRLPFFRRHYLFPFLPSLTLSQQADLCKIHVVLSLGLLQPGFLLTLLFLVNVSIKKRKPDDTWATAFVSATCFPILILQVFFVFFSPDMLPPIYEVFQRSSVITREGLDKPAEAVLCAYPLLSTIVFSAFGVSYALVFVLSCWRAASLVINRGLRLRIYALAISVMVTLPVEILFLGLSVLWRPEEAAYVVVVLVACVSVVACAAAGEGILVIVPIVEALSSSGDCCRWRPGAKSPPEKAGNV